MLANMHSMYYGYIIGYTDYVNIASNPTWRNHPHMYMVCSSLNLWTHFNQQ